MINPLKPNNSVICYCKEDDLNFEKVISINSLEEFAQYDREIKRMY